MEAWMEDIIDSHWKHIAFRPRCHPAMYKEGDTLSCSCTAENFLLARPSGRKIADAVDRTTLGWHEDILDVHKESKESSSL